MIQLPIEICSIQNDGYHLFVSVQIATHNLRLLIDTGASRSAFDRERMKDYLGDYAAELNQELTAGLGSNSMQSHVFVIERICLGDLVIEDYQTVAVDMSHVNETYEQIGKQPIDGVLGGDLLKEYKAVIDYQKEILYLQE